MKIAVIGAKGLPPKQGGIEHYCAELYPRLVEAGHSVDFFARSTYTEHPWFHCYDYGGVRVITLPCLGFKGIAALMSSALAVLSSGRYDVIHFHALGPALFSWFPRCFSAATVVVICHGLDWQRNKWGWWSRRLIQMGEKIAVRFAHHLFVVSQDLRTYFRKTYQQEVIYAPNAPPIYARSNPEFRYGKALDLEPRRYILFLGRLVPEKCPDILIRAFQSLQLLGWKLVLVGSQSETPTFSQSLQTLATGDPSIVFTGELQGTQLAEVVRGAGLFVLPSSLEGLPLAMLEAMQEGIPVLGSDIPPHQQLLAPDRGLLFAVENIEACAERIAWAVDHPKKMSTMAKRAQQYIKEHYTWESIVQEHLGLIETLPKMLSSQKRSLAVKKTSVSIASLADE